MYGCVLLVYMCLYYMCEGARGGQERAPAMGTRQVPSGGAAGHLSSPYFHCLTHRYNWHIQARVSDARLEGLTCYLEPTLRVFIFGSKF